MGQPFLLIIPGASASPYLYDAVVKPVRAKGVEIKALPLPSVGYKSGPPPTLYDDAAFIQSQVKELADDNKELVLVTHCYGGAPATQSIAGISKKARQVEGKPGGVVGIAYMTSLIPELGQPAASVQAGLAEEQKVLATVDKNGWISYENIPRVAELSFSGMPKEEGEHWAAKLVSHSAAAFGTPLTYLGFKDVPVSYLLCENDLTTPPHTQQAGINYIEHETGNKVNVTSVKADHVGPLSDPGPVIKWLLDVAAAHSS